MAWEEVDLIEEAGKVGAEALTIGAETVALTIVAHAETTAEISVIL